MLLTDNYSLFLPRSLALLLSVYKLYLTEESVFWANQISKQTNKQKYEKWNSCVCVQALIGDGLKRKNRLYYSGTCIKISLHNPFYIKIQTAKKCQTQDFLLFIIHGVCAY